MVRKIPVGYLTKQGVDIQLDDVVARYGQVLHVRHEQNCIFYDHIEHEEYVSDGIVATFPSQNPDDTIEYLFGFYEDVRILQYEIII